MKRRARLSYISLRSTSRISSPSRLDRYIPSQSYRISSKTVPYRHFQTLAEFKCVELVFAFLYTTFSCRARNKAPLIYPRGRLASQYPFIHILEKLLDYLNLPQWHRAARPSKEHLYVTSLCSGLPLDIDIRFVEVPLENSACCEIRIPPFCITIMSKAPSIAPHSAESKRIRPLEGVKNDRLA